MLSQTFQIFIVVRPPLWVRVTVACMILPPLCQAQMSMPAADQPIARTDRNSLTAHEELLDKVKKGRIDIYFEGDSITRRWGATDYPDLLANWKQNFFGWNAANFGWGADTTQNILWRLENGELDGIYPKVIVLLAGTNNLSSPAQGQSNNARAADITKGIKAILDIMLLKAPEATIILMGIFPRNDKYAFVPVINRINNDLSNLADGEKIRYLNINDRLADSNGTLLEGVMNSGDKLHPTIKGYQIWADALKPIFLELLGPPAAEDHAPPPTGNPAAQRPKPAAGSQPGRHADSPVKVDEEARSALNDSSLTTPTSTLNSCI